MLRQVAFLALLFCLVNSPIQAAEINKEGAQRLKTLFSTYIEKRKNAAQSQGGALQTNGDIVVEQASDYYAVTLPSITLSNEEGMQGEIGLIAINATPTDNPDNWTMSIAVPTPILYKDKEGKPTMRVDIGAQEMGGLWNGSLENFSKLSAKYSNIKLTHFDKQEVLNIGQFNIATDLKENKKDYWSGPTKISVAKLSIGKPEGIQLVTLEDAGIFIEFENFSPKKQFEEISKITTDTDETISGSILKNLGDAFSFKAVIKNLLINSVDIPTVEAKGLSLSNLTMNFSVKDLQSSKIQQALQLSFDGLKLKDSKRKEDALFPDKMDLNLSLKNLPLMDIITLAEKLIPSGEDQQAARQVAALQAMLTLPKMLSDAGTVLTLSDTNYSNDIYQANLRGTVKANPNSIFGATGDIFFTIDQIDETLKKLGEKEKQQDNIKKLIAIKEVCKKESEPKTICHITLDEAAKLSVNGQDMKILLEALSGK